MLVRSTTLGSLLLLVVVVVGCAGGDVATDRTRSPVPAGINQSYLAEDLDPSEWVNRFEAESREIYTARHEIVAAVGAGPGDRVADIGAGKTYRFDIASDGRLGRKTLVCERGSDGMTLDNEGNLYLTGNGVLVLDKQGRQIEHIEVPDERWTANVSFFGRDRQTLFITASEGIYSIRMRVKGANAAK